MLDSFKTIKARYDASRRLFAHDFRGGKYDKSAFLHLVIRKVVDRQEKRIQVIAYDVLEQKNRWVLFRPSDLHEIAEGVTVKLFFPWLVSWGSWPFVYITLNHFHFSVTHSLLASSSVGKGGRMEI